MNYDIKFRFITKTLNKDYKVYYLSGNKVLLDVDDYKPIRDYSGYVSEINKESIVLSHINDKYMLSCFYMDIGENDRAGRPIKFYFTKIYDKNEADKALSLFGFLTSLARWEQLEEKVKELRKVNAGETVQFDENGLNKWFESQSVVIHERNKNAEPDKWYQSDCSDIILRDGLLLKWELKKDPERVQCARVRSGSKEIKKVLKKNKSSSLWIVLALVISLIVFVSVISKCGSGRGREKILLPVTSPRPSLGGLPQPTSGVKPTIFRSVKGSGDRPSSGD